MTGSVSVIREWEPENPVMCAKLIEYITEKMAEFHAPCLFCRFSREAYTVDTGQRDALVNEIKDLTARLPGKDKEINYAGTDDIMMTVRLPQKLLAEKGQTLFSYFSELLLLVPEKSCDWDRFLSAFRRGHPAKQLKEVRKMPGALLLVSTDEGLVRIEN